MRLLPAGARRPSGAQRGSSPSPGSAAAQTSGPRGRLALCSRELEVTETELGPGVAAEHHKDRSIPPGPLTCQEPPPARLLLLLRLGVARSSRVPGAPLRVRPRGAAALRGFPCLGRVCGAAVLPRGPTRGARGARGGQGRSLHLLLGGGAAGQGVTDPRRRSPQGALLTPPPTERALSRSCGVTDPQEGVSQSISQSVRV